MFFKNLFLSSREHHTQFLAFMWRTSVNYVVECTMIPISLAENILFNISLSSDLDNIVRIAENIIVFHHFFYIILNILNVM